MMKDKGYGDPTDESPGGRYNEDEPVPRWALPSGEKLATGALALDMARAWVEDNLNTAVLGAFAAGVFLGVMMRR